jgi:lipid-binding SYLF domain-containing protein
MKGLAMKKKMLWISGVVCILVVLAGCSTAPKKTEARAVLSAEVNEAVAIFKAQDPTIQSFFDNSYGYAVLPKVTKGAFWFGVAGGRGQVFKQGQMAGYCKMGQATLGFSFGGEFFREILFFRQVQDLDRFISGEYTLSAQVTGTAVTVGAAAKADYKDGMAVFVMADRGLMVDASLGGQKFSYSAAAME